MRKNKKSNFQNIISTRMWTRNIKLVVFLVSFGLIGATFLLKSYAITSSEPPMGLMIQVSSLAPNTTPATLKTYLSTIRKNHRDKSKPGYINSIVLQDIADQNGNLLTSYLDVIKPFLPGGSTPAFDRAFIGTIDLNWSGSGSKYIEGIANATFRDKNVNLSKTVAQAFKKRYPLIKTDWYITYEANLAGFWDSNIETNYLTYINQLTIALSSVTSGKTFMWSPAFWTPYRNEPDWALPGLKTNFNDLFSKIQAPIILNFQDFVGQSNGNSTKEDAVIWLTYLKQNVPSLSNIQINVEQFKQNTDGSIVPGDSTELPAREKYYVKNGIKLGPAWEIRYWYKRLY
ncbi:hypothetical protein HY003_00485 [Candidatus Saccharibacteria bacterium]|nr:hypothetical protein [Candidatus Saccharibacteria bacterium]MBI3337765.1 hypothetical protein [Candidatus Saccharibacteria bacterium]